MEFGGISDKIFKQGHTGSCQTSPTCKSKCIKENSTLAWGFYQDFSMFDDSVKDFFSKNTGFEFSF